MALAQKEIERLTITASFDGILESDTAELGSLLQPGSLCATVIQLDPINWLALCQKPMSTVCRWGLLARARLSSGGTVSGQVIFISRSADQTTRTFRVDVEVDNADLSIRDGQTVDMIIQAEGTIAHLVPGSALTLNNAGDLGLRIVDNTDTARFVPVTLLRDTVEGVWLSGLPETADIIVVGQEFVTDGVSVKVTYQ